MITATPSDLIDRLLTPAEWATAHAGALDSLGDALDPEDGPDALVAYVSLGSPSNPAWTVYRDDVPGQAYRAATRALGIGVGTESRIWALAYCLAWESQDQAAVAGEALRLAVLLACDRAPGLVGIPEGAA